jgi:hypothetical protein
VKDDAAQTETVLRSELAEDLQLDAVTGGADMDVDGFLVVQVP